MEEEQESQDQRETEELEGLQGRIDRLEAELAIKREEAEEHLDQLKRLRADFDNFRKRMIKEQTRIIEYALEDHVSRLLPILDNLERAIKSAEACQQLDPLLEGVKMTHRLLLDQLSKEGLRQVEVGAPFSPEAQEAIEVVFTEAYPEGSIVEVLEPGYSFKKKLLRPAKVKVARSCLPAVAAGAQEAWPPPGASP